MAMMCAPLLCPAVDDFGCRGIFYGLLFINCSSSAPMAEIDFQILFFGFSSP